MKKITAITPQLKKGRFNIFLDEKFFRGITEETYLELRLHVGQMIEENELENMIAIETKNQCFVYSLWLLGKRNYFENDLIKKLNQKEYEEVTIQETIKRLHSYGYLNDERLAEQFISDKKRFSNKGSNAILYQLRQKGLDTDEFKKLFLEEEEIEKGLTAAKKKLEVYKQKTSNEYELRNKVSAFLRQRGFSFSTITAIVDQLF